MLSLRTAGAVCALLAVAMPAASLADTMGGSHMSSMSQIKDIPSRFSGPGVYVGQPALPVTLSLVIAGGGPDKFSTVTLLKTLAGSKFQPEVAKLTTQYSKDKVGNFIKVFDFVVADSLKIVTEKHIALPKTPSPDPKNGPALAGALWAAGQTGHGFNVEVMLDRAVSHPIHDQVMKDIDAKYGIAADADYHAILTTAMKDLASAYALKS